MTLLLIHQKKLRVLSALDLYSLSSVTIPREEVKDPDHFVYSLCFCFWILINHDLISYFIDIRFYFRCLLNILVQSNARLICMIHVKSDLPTAIMIAGWIDGNLVPLTSMLKVTRFLWLGAFSVLNEEKLAILLWQITGNPIFDWYTIYSTK